MLTRSIYLENFDKKKKLIKIQKYLKDTLKKNNEIIKSLKPGYKYSFTKKILSKSKKINEVSLIGMGGSILGARTIYNFLGHKIKKNFLFIDNIKTDKIRLINSKKRLNLIIYFLIK